MENGSGADDGGGLGCQPEECGLDLQGSEKGRVRVKVRGKAREGREEAACARLGPWAAVGRRGRRGQGGIYR